ncbi:glycosyltransferase [Pseudoalteromonas piscicida]
MKISLIVPTYNSAEYIQACLASLVTQLEGFAENHRN